MAAAQLDPGANRVPWVKPWGFTSCGFYDQLEDEILEGWVSLGSRCHQTGPQAEEMGTRAESTSCPVLRFAFQKHLHLKQNQTHVVLLKASAAPSPSFPCEKPPWTLN